MVHNETKGKRGKTMTILETKEKEALELLSTSDMSISEVSNRTGLSMSRIRDLSEKSIDKRTLKEHTGDREKAIELLETTTLTYKEISEQTGVPLGSIAPLARKHRPKEMRLKNTPWKKSKISNWKKEEPEEKHPITHIVEETKEEPVERTFDFSRSFNIELEGTEVPVSDFIKEINSVRIFLQEMKNAKVSFSIGINVRGEKE